MAKGRQSSSDWFVQDSTGVRGPISETEMRKLVRTTKDPGLQVRQGRTGWHSAALIRKKMADLAAHGIYISCNGIATGPFTMTKAFELINKNSMEGVQVRTGRHGDWISAADWLVTLQDLRRRRKLRKQQAAKDAAQQSSPSTAPTAKRKQDIAAVKKALSDAPSEAPSVREPSVEPVASKEPVVTEAIAVVEEVIQPLRIEPRAVVESVPVSPSEHSSQRSPDETAASDSPTIEQSQAPIAEQSHSPPTSVVPVAPTPEPVETLGPFQSGRRWGDAKPTGWTGSKLITVGSLAMTVLIVVGAIGFKTLYVSGEPAPQSSAQPLDQELPANAEPIESAATSSAANPGMLTGTEADPLEP